MKFSLSAQAFYAGDIDYGNNIPTDAVDITDTQYQQFYAGLNSGSVIYAAGDDLKISDVRPNHYAIWDTASSSWVMTAAASEQKASDEKAVLSNYATSEFSRATDQISVLSDKIELSDYSAGETSDSVTAERTQWKAYRIACNAVMKGAATNLQAAPDA